MTHDNHSATYLNNTPGVYGYYKRWTPDGRKSTNGRTIHYSTLKNILEDAGTIVGEHGATSNNFSDGNPIQ
jgi:hypothetical protein